MKYQPQNIGELAALAFMTFHQGATWVASTFMDLMWSLWLLTPEGWPVWARLLVFPAATYALGWAVQLARRGARFVRSFH